MSKTASPASALDLNDDAHRKAEKPGVPMNVAVAVADAGAQLVAFMRTDEAWLGGTEIARDKAYTARAFDMTILDLAKLSRAGDPAYGIAVGTRRLFSIFPGGIPLKVGDEAIGAERVSRGAPGLDHAVAEAGVEASVPDAED